MSLGLRKTCILLYIRNTVVSRVSLDSATLCNCGSQNWVSTSHGGGLVKAQPAGPASSIFALVTSSQVVVLLLAWAHTWRISAPESSSFEIPNPPGCSITMLPERVGKSEKSWNTASKSFAIPNVLNLKDGPLVWDWFYFLWHYNFPPFVEK